MYVPPGYLPSSRATKLLKVSDTALRKWAENGSIHYYRNGERGKRWYNVKEFLERNSTDIKPEKQQPPRERIIYARVSTRNQKDDLERQCNYLRSRYPNHTLIKDIGSGLNYKRKGLKTILESAINGNVEELVVAHKDRLCRFGFELLDWIIQSYSKGKIVVLNNNKSSQEEELCKDLLSIITVFGSKANGLRKYKSVLSKEIKKQEGEKEKGTKDSPSENTSDAKAEEDTN